MCIIDSICALREKWVFCSVDDDRVSGVVVGVGKCSTFDEIGSVFRTSAEETRGRDKMRHFHREKACFKRNHFVATGNP